MLNLEPFSDKPPADAPAMLMELGEGETGFGGTEFGQGEMGLIDYLQHTMTETDANNLPTNRVPQTTFWIVENGTAVGLLRMRHVLNDALRINGGHIGYYIRLAARRRGLATNALRLGLIEITNLGVTQVMLTTNPENQGSIRVIEKNGGTLKSQIPDPSGSGTINQYWIETAPIPT